MKTPFLLLATSLLGLSTFTSQAALVTVVGGSISATTNTTWLTNGFATLGGNTSGVNWKVNAQQEGADWNFVSFNGGGDENYGTGVSQVEWPSTGNIQGLGFAFRDTLAVAVVLSVGSSMITDLSSTPFLRISTVVPYAGNYTLNGFTVTGASYGQVVSWYVASNTLALNDTMEFTSTAVVTAFPNAKISAGAIGFSGASVVPEPSTALLGGIGALILGFRAAHRRRRG